MPLLFQSPVTGRSPAEPKVYWQSVPVSVPRTVPVDVQVEHMGRIPEYPDFRRYDRGRLRSRSAVNPRGIDRPVRPGRVGRNDVPVSGAREKAVNVLVPLVTLDRNVPSRYTMTRSNSADDGSVQFHVIYVGAYVTLWRPEIPGGGVVPGVTRIVLPALLVIPPFPTMRVALYDPGLRYLVTDVPLKRVRRVDPSGTVAVTPVPRYRVPC